MQWKLRILLTSVAILLLTVVHDLSSQNNPFRARVDLVVVPVSVRDNNGSLVTNLEPEDFTVLEDGKPQRITNFSMDAQPLSAAIVIDDGVAGPALGQVFKLVPSIG